jgi:hypothetical protein
MEDRASSVQDTVMALVSSWLVFDSEELITASIMVG